MRMGLWSNDMGYRERPLKAPREGGHLQVRKKALTRNQIFWYLDHGLLVLFGTLIIGSGTMRNVNSVL